MHPQQHHFNNRQDPRDDWTLYPEPPTAMDMCQQQQQQPPVTYTYSTAMTPELLAGMSPVAFNPSWPDQPVPFLGHSSPSPPSASDEADLQVPSSGLSSASGPSASSSAAGSPQSFHGQLAIGGEWSQNQNFSVVGQGLFAAATEYQPHQFGQSLEEFQFAADLPVNKTVPFGGESQSLNRGSDQEQQQQQQQQHASVSSPTATIVPPDPGLEPDLASPMSSAAPASRRSSLAFVPVTPTTVSFPSPPQAHPAQCPPFFSQSSGHFVAPLESSYPTVIHPEMRIPITTAGPYEAFQPPQASMYPPPPSPSMSSSPQPPHYGNGFPQFPGGPFQAPVDHRRASVISSFSVVSHDQPSHSGDEGGKEKQRCPHPDCGKVFKDLKSHMITHQNERPEKCPIVSCDYHTKGFARKYDKNRHTLTHYKGTMVCGFCPGSGSAAEKSFNRADVFKRHLTAVHGVEQTPPNSRKKSATSAANSGKKLTGYAPDATGKCSTCGGTFSNAQDFYEHLDDCVLKQVQKEDPAEAVNARHMAEVENDQGVIDTLEKNHLPTATPSNAPSFGEDDEDDEMSEEDEARNSQRSPTRKTTKTGPANGVQKSKGMTHSRGGVSLPTKSRARKNRRDYPSSWGFDKGQMTMKKRVMVAFDGPRRLAKDDMMLSTEHEVRIPLSDGRSYVTDLDVQTMKRAEGFHQATEEEKGPWISDDPTEEQRQAMLMQLHAAE